MQIVPFDMIYQRARHDVEGVWESRHRPKSSEPPLLHISSPSPVADSELVVKHLLKAANAELAVEIENDIKRCGPSSPEFRLKLWTVYAAATRDVCCELGVVYVDPPAGAMDASGYILPQLASDSLHGTDDYGRMVLADLRARLV